MGTHMEDITGKVFNKLTAIKAVESNGFDQRWLFKCECGNVVAIRSRSVKSGNTKSCGCLRRETSKNLQEKHGMYYSRLYKILESMKYRCCNENSNNFHNYGGRGITICDEWLNDRESFFKWALSNGYSDELTIDRINNDEGYYPENCRWATTEQQHNNTRSNIYLNIDGVVKTIAEWSKCFGVNPVNAYARIYKGWDFVRSVKTPVKNRNKK